MYAEASLGQCPMHGSIIRCLLQQHTDVHVVSVVLQLSINQLKCTGSIHAGGCTTTPNYQRACMSMSSTNPHDRFAQLYRLS